MRLTLILALLAALAAGQKTNPGEVQLAGAIKKEVVDGDLKGAIEQYKKIIAANRANHALAAKALVQMGQCYEKLGDAEARKAYDQVLKDYADQKDLAETARGRLAKLGGGGATARSERLVWELPFNYSTYGGPTPDGRYLAAIDWNRQVVVVHDFVTRQEQAVTEAPRPGMNEWPDGPVLSPDAKKVAYAWYSNGVSELRTVNADGSGMRVLLKQSVWPDYWSADGKYILATQISPTGSIIRISTSDGSVRALRSGADGATGLGDTSPDGKHLLYHGRMPNSKVSQCLIMSADGQLEWPVSPASSSCGRSAWSKDGSRIVFTSDRGGSPGLWAVRVENGKPQGEPELLKADAVDVSSFASDGSLFFDRTTRQRDIYVASLDPVTGKLTSEPKRVNERSIGNSYGRIAWLPDSRSLSFWAGRTGPAALVVHTLATGEEREIPAVTGYLGWLPDGSLMSRQNNGPSQEVRRIDARTGETLAAWKIGNDIPEATNAGVSRDLMTLFFARTDPASCENGTCTYALVARSLETAKDRQVSTIKSTTPLFPSVSPDGHMLAFIAGIGDEWLLMTAPTDGTPREIYRSKDFPISVRNSLTWTEDGRHILAFSYEKGKEAVWSFPAQGGPPEKSMLHMPISGPSPVVSPDGTKVAFVGAVTKKEVWVMTGLFPGSKPTRADASVPGQKPR